MKALIIADFTEKQLDMINALGYDLIHVRREGNIPYDQTEDVEIMLTYKEISTMDFNKLPNLKVVQLTSIGFDQVPKEEAIKRNIAVANNKGCYSIPMGEWIVLKILEIYKDSRYFIESQNNRVWKWNWGLLELTGKTVGFLGTGTVSYEGAKRLSGFDLRILGMNTSGRDTKGFDKCYSYEQRYEMAAQCDILVCAVPNSDKTYHIVDKKMLETLPKGGTLINVGRGEAVDIPALIEALESEKLRGAALDVFETEPLEKDSPLWGTKNLYISPHNCWVSEHSMQRIFETAYENLARYIQGRELINLVNLKRGY